MVEFFHADCKSLLLQFTHQEKQLKLKRRWLAGLPLTREPLRQFKGPKSEIERAIPESLLREDDVYYETVKAFVKNRIGQCKHLFCESDESHHDAVLKILNRLEDFPTQALTAMHRRLIGIKAYVPQLKAPTKQGLRRDVLIQKVRELCTELLTEFDESDDELLQKPLAEAMTVGSLTLKLILGCDIVKDFKLKRVSPDVDFFQNQVAKAICLLNQKGRFEEMKNLQALLDPNAKLTNKRLQLAVKRLLTEYLFECDDLQNIPKWLLETLAIVNKSSQSSSCRMEANSISRDVEDEVECILSVSALTRQVVWDLFPDNGFDFDFSNAYMEDLEESDDEVEFLKNDNGCKDQSESIGEVPSASRTERDDWSSFFESNGMSDVKLESVKVKVESVDDAVEMDAVDSYPCTSSSSSSRVDSSGEVNYMHDEESVIKNKYVVIQEGSDETSKVAYGLIGCLLEKFAERDGLDLDDDAISYLRDTDEITRKMITNLSFFKLFKT